MNDLRTIIKICKDNKLDPRYVEEITATGSNALVDDGLLSVEENAILIKATSEDVKKIIMDVYLNGEVASLPKDIRIEIRDAKKEIDCQAWSVVTDWLVGISDYPFDEAMCEWIGNGKGRAMNVYSYMLNQEI